MSKADKKVPNPVVDKKLFSGLMSHYSFSRVPRMPDPPRQRPSKQAGRGASGAQPKGAE